MQSTSSPRALGIACVRLLPLTLAVLILTGQSPSIAADWLQLDRNADGDTMLIDRSSIDRDGALIRFTEQIVFVKPRQTPRHGSLKSLRTRYAMNCKSQTNAPLVLQAVTVNSDVVGLSPDAMANPEFISIAENPRAPDRIAFNYLCIPK